MQTICQLCSSSIKEVGRLMSVWIDHNKKKICKYCRRKRNMERYYVN